MMWPNRFKNNSTTVLPGPLTSGRHEQMLRNVFDDFLAIKFQQTGNKMLHHLTTVTLLITFLVGWVQTNEFVGHLGHQIRDR